MASAAAVPRTTKMTVKGLDILQAGFRNEITIRPYSQISAGPKSARRSEPHGEQQIVSVIVARLRSRLGASNRMLELVAEQRLIPLVTTALFLEYEEVLKRAEQRLTTGMSEVNIAGFLGAFVSAAEPVEVHFLWRPLLSAPDDELVLECAVNGSAEAIVTHNTRHFMPAFRELSMATITPGTLLKRFKA